MSLVCVPSSLQKNIIITIVRFGLSNQTENVLAQQVVSIAVSVGATAATGGCACGVFAVALLFYRRKKKERDPDAATVSILKPNNCPACVVNLVHFNKADQHRPVSMPFHVNASYRKEDLVNPLFEFEGN